MIRAVVVDDDKDALQLFSELLISNGIKIVGKGHNGQDAVFLYQKLKPDILFLDVLMPVYDGIYAVKKIRDTYPESIIVAIFDKLSVGKEIELTRLKPSAIIKEPIDVDDILRITHKLCMPAGDSLDQMKRTMVTLAIKNTFLELGLEEYDKIVLMLQKDFNASLEDCYDNPEYLKQVLSDLLGDSYNDVLNSLKENLKNISSNKTTENFLDALSSQ